VSLSIRWRLTLWNTLAGAAVLLGFAALVYGLLSRALYGQTDRKLRAGLVPFAQDSRLPEEPDARLRHWVYELYEHEGIFCVVYDPGGGVRERTTEMAQDSVPPAPSDVPARPRLRDATLPILGRQRVLEARLPVAGPEHTVVLLAPLEEVDHELGRLLAVLALAVPVALAAWGGLGYMLARKALAPVDRLQHSTRHITANRLDRRLPVANPADELGGLAVTINDMIGRLQHSFAEVRRFTADASHELRTPLTAIRTEAEVALSRAALPEDQQRLLASILEECDRLTRLTDQLLTLAREDAGVGLPVREPVDLAALARDVAETMRPLAEARGLRLIAGEDTPVFVRGDATRLRQVFTNLLDNAIKYTPAGGEVGVHVEAGEDWAMATVRDTGVGIPPEHLPRVFDRFYRVDRARRREEGGTGLGLSIVRSIVESHGGHVSLRSEPGQGTTCVVTLLLAES
jgi:heavy metal sensor kinase